jgi:uncharacterized membrane protein
MAQLEESAHCARPGKPSTAGRRLVEDQIIALGFEGVSTAEEMLSLFMDMQDKGTVSIKDAVIAYRKASGPVEIKQTHSEAGKYTLRGSGIGLLAGLLLGGPIGGLVGGAAVGAIAAGLKDFGIDDKFIRGVTEALAPSSSMLFLMGNADDPEKFEQELKPFKAIVVTTTLSDEQEKRLKDILAEEG